MQKSSFSNRLYFLQHAPQPANADTGSHQQCHLTAFPVQHGHLPNHVSTVQVDYTHTHTRSALFHFVSEFFIVCSTQIHAGAADHRPFVLHATGQLQRRPRALPSLHVPHNDPAQQFHHQPVPVSLPHTASGFSALPAATAAPAVLSGTAPICDAATLCLLVSESVFWTLATSKL